MINTAKTRLLCESVRLSRVPASPIRKLVPFAEKAKKSGIRVYHLNIGDPDIQTPSEMIQVVRTWKLNPVSYAHSQGDSELLNALRAYYKRLGFPFIQKEHIQVTSGGSEAIFWAFFATCNPKDEVIVFEPFYTNYNSFAVIAGIRLVPIKTYVESGFHLPHRKEIERHITSKTRAILYCSPGNPTGTVYTKAEIELLVSICKRNNLFLLSDEVYREFVYDGKKQISILSYINEIPDRAVLLDSLSKRYSLCGARVGALVSLNKDIMEGVLRMAQGRLSAGLIDQKVAAGLTKVPSSYIQKVRIEYENRRNILYNGLSKIPGIVLSKPEGAFYIIARLPVKDAEHFCMWLLTDFRDRRETVMLAPAKGFYITEGMGESEVRIAYVLNITHLKRSIEILSKALANYPRGLR